MTQNTTAHFSNPNGDINEVIILDKNQIACIKYTSIAYFFFLIGIVIYNDQVYYAITQVKKYNTDLFDFIISFFY